MTDHEIKNPKRNEHQFKKDKGGWEKIVTTCDTAQGTFVSV